MQLTEEPSARPVVVPVLLEPDDVPVRELEARHVDRVRGRVLARIAGAAAAVAGPPARVGAIVLDARDRLAQVLLRERLEDVALPQIERRGERTRDLH